MKNIDPQPASQKLVLKDIFNHLNRAPCHPSHLDAAIILISNPAFDPTTTHDGNNVLHEAARLNKHIAKTVFQALEGRFDEASIGKSKEFKEDLANKKVFTTGEAAEVCNISQQTIIRCFDHGRLQGFRVPGSKFRRIPRDELIKFMENYDIPTDILKEGILSVLKKLLQQKNLQDKTPGEMPCGDVYPSV